MITTLNTTVDKGYKISIVLIALMWKPQGKPWIASMQWKILTYQISSALTLWVHLASFAHIMDWINRSTLSLPEPTQITLASQIRLAPLKHQTYFQFKASLHRHQTCWHARVWVVSASALIHINRGQTARVCVCVCVCVRGVLDYAVF